MSCVPTLFFLFVANVTFKCFVLLPLILGFLVALSKSVFATFFAARGCFRFILRLALPFNFLFRLPIIVVFLADLNVLGPCSLRGVEGCTCFILVIITVLIAPPSFVSSVLIALPLLLLCRTDMDLSGVVCGQGRGGRTILRWLWWGSGRGGDLSHGYPDFSVVLLLGAERTGT